MIQSATKPCSASSSVWRQPSRPRRPKTDGDTPGPPRQTDHYPPRLAAQHNGEMGASVSFGDHVRHVRIVETDETRRGGWAGLVGQCDGFTTPSVTGVRVVGGPADLAFSVHFEDGSVPDARRPSMSGNWQLIWPDTPEATANGKVAARR